LSRAIAKLASINLQKLVLSPTGSIKPWFHTEGNFLLCSSYLPLGVPNWAANTAPSKHFSGAVVREKEDFYKGSLSLPIFYSVIVLLTLFTLFLFASFYQKIQKN
jgi:hypothetical protein